MIKPKTEFLTKTKAKLTDFWVSQAVTAVT